MKKAALSLVFFVSFIAQSFASEAISKKLMAEWTKFRTQVDSIEPQGDIGGYMLYRDYSSMTLLWRTSSQEGENEVIRFFMQRPNGTVFAVTYHKTDVIIPGKVVLRRFIGTEPVGWINHTIDFESGDYLGSQGELPELLSVEKKMMKQWGIKI